MWNGLHAFPLVVEERVLTTWQPSPAAREAVLGVARAVLDIIETKAVKVEHISAFMTSARLPDEDARAWGPGVQQLVAMSRIFPPIARRPLRELLEQPRTAARVLGAMPTKGCELETEERERAMNTLLEAPAAQRAEALAGEALRIVRIEVQRRDAELRPRGVDATLVELRRYLGPRPPRRPRADFREPPVLVFELSGRMKPRHLVPLLKLVERWPDEDMGGFLMSLVRCADAVRGGRRALRESFQRRPTLAVADVLHYGRDRAWPALLHQGLRRRLSKNLRRDLASMAEDLPLE